MAPMQKKAERQPLETPPDKQDQDRQAQLEELAALYEVSLAVGRTLNLDELLPLALKTITGLQLFRVLKKGGIFIVDGDELKLASYLGKGHTPEFLEMHSGLKMGQCLCGAAAYSGEVIVSRDSSRDPQHTIAYPQMSPHGHIIVPLKAGERVVGVMYLYVAAGAEIPKRSIGLLTTIGAQLGVAIENALNMADEQHVAEVLQSALLSPVPSRPDMDIGLVYSAAGRLGRVGGDFYDFVELEDGRLAVVVGDTSGKGLENTTYSAMVKFTLRAYLEEGKPPCECLNLLNRSLSREIHEDKFITLCLLVLDPKNERPDYCCAGHPPPFFAGTGGRAQFMNSTTCPPLGVDIETLYSSSTANTGDTKLILLYTDGLSEARNSEGALFGAEGITAAIGPLEKSAQDLAEGIAEAARRHSNGCLTDDMTLIVLKLHTGG